MHRLIILLCYLLVFSGSAAAEEEFLKPAEAFVISASAGGGSVKFKWDIADGYYLYQSKFRFKSANEQVVLSDPKLPPGVNKKDPIFGDIEVYRDQVEIALPIQNSDNLPDLLEIEARSQGCADAGICYPPQTQTVLVALNAATDQPFPVDQEAVASMQQSLEQQ